MTVRVLFVCLGNICRSPMAEAVFQKLLEDAELDGAIEVDSAATGAYHVGERAHPGARRVLAKHDIAYAGRARQLRPDELADDDTYVIVMDQSNLSTIRRTYGEHPRLYRLLDFAEQQGARDVPDPYYTGDFETVYQLVEDGARGLLEMIRKQEGL